MFGPTMLRRVKDNIQNPFWRDAISAWEIFIRSYRPTEDELWYEPVWFSEYTKFKTNIVRRWDNRGIRFIGDLWNSPRRRFMLRAEIEEKYEIRMNFLEYESLLRSLPQYLRRFNGSFVFAQPTIPCNIQLINDTNKVSRLAYSIFVAKEIKDDHDHNLRLKWIRDVGRYEKGSLLKVTAATRSIRLANFHYKLVKRILVTNRFLYLCGIVEDSNCTFCERNEESLYHVFWECQISQNYIADVSRLLIRVGYNIEITRTKWFFLDSCDNLEALVITLAKSVLYRARVLKMMPSSAHFKATLKSEREIEHFAALMNSEMERYIKKWQVLEGIDRS